MSRFSKQFFPCKININQSGTMLFDLDDHDLPRMIILRRFSASVIRSTFSQYQSTQQLFSLFPLLRFPSSIPVVTRCSSFFSLLIPYSKKVAWRLLILHKSDVVEYQNIWNKQKNIFLELNSFCFEFNLLHI